MKSDNLLFHYTDICAAKSILQSGVLYFSHHQKMNDKTEFFHADDLLFSAAKQDINEVFKQDRRRRVSPKGILYQQALKRESEKLIKALSGALGNDYYIFSSTQHANKYEMENGSLVMWRGYGKENGCAIVFEKEKLVGLADSLAKNGNVASTIDGEVCYLKDANELETKFETEYWEFIDYLKDMVSRLSSPTRVHLTNPAIGMKTYIKMKVLTKHHAFTSENEYRLSILRSIPGMIDKERKLIPVADGKVRLPIDSPIIPIKKIIISPFFNQDDNYKIMREFIKSSPKYLNIHITKSAIPYKETPSKP